MNSTVYVKGLEKMKTTLNDLLEFFGKYLNVLNKEYMARTYRLSKPWDWTSTPDFLERVARQSGKLLKGGEPDLNTVEK